MAMSRAKSAAESPALQWVDEVFQAEYPALFEFLRESTWDDGKPRKTGTFLVCLDHGALKCAVHDRDGRRCAWVTGDTFRDLLASVELGLSTDSLPWRKDTR